MCICSFYFCRCWRCHTDARIPRDPHQSHGQAPTGKCKLLLEKTNLEEHQQRPNATPSRIGLSSSVELQALSTRIYKPHNLRIYSNRQCNWVCWTRPATHLWPTTHLVHLSLCCYESSTLLDLLNSIVPHLGGFQHIEKLILPTKLRITSGHGDISTMDILAEAKYPLPIMDYVSKLSISLPS